LYLKQKKVDSKDIKKREKSFFPKKKDLLKFKIGSRMLFNLQHLHLIEAVPILYPTFTIAPIISIVGIEKDIYTINNSSI